ncbi:MAG: hypothetical protein IKS94_01385 [Prevotella sp.]|nr:hypothetical protein [Prevotella sp.]
MNKNLSIKVSSIPNWKDANYTNLIDAINKLPGVPVKDITLGDLQFPPDECTGIYLFQEGENHCMFENGTHKPDGYWYIGKNESVCFSGRIGVHLAPRHNDDQNQVLRNIAWVLSRQKRQKDFFDDKIVSPAQRKKFIDKAFPVMLDLRLKLVIFDSKDTNCKSDIRAVEKELIKQLNPYLNYPNRKPRILEIKRITT